MKTVRYKCTHCGRSFEAEEKDIVECPGCYWSTSVKREDEIPAEVSTPSPSSFQPGEPGSVSNLLRSIVKILPVLIASAAIIGMVIFAGPKVLERFKALELTRQKGQVEIKPDHEVKKPGMTQNPLELLTEEEKAVLNRHLHLTVNRPISDEEKKILENRVELRTGKIERLPSQAWSLQQFKEMLEQQEKMYKVPLPRSYKNKLDDGFKQHYTQGEIDFKAGDLLKARDAWVRALIFPIYSNDIKKHRGVALTMLRPFISDTLSKIGAINSTLVEQKIRDTEQEIAQKYSELSGLLEKKSWTEASAVILNLDQLSSQLDNPKLLAGSAPNYPEDIQKVDEDIRMTLFEMRNAGPPPAVADLEPLRQDLQLKRKIIESFSPQNLEAAQGRYDQAIDYITQQNWVEAEKELRQVDLPLELVKDAQEKVKVLNKLQKTSA